MTNNQTVFSFKIEGEGFELPKEKVTAKQIIELAKEKGLPAANPPIEDLMLKSGEDLYSGNEEVDLSKENDFSLGPKIYKFKVNGQGMESEVNKLTAKKIIELAKEKGVTLPRWRKRKSIVRIYWQATASVQIDGRSGFKSVS